MEYAPWGSPANHTPSQILEANLDHYGQFVSHAASQRADIIVFPEYGLTTITPSSFSRINARPYLQTLPSLNESAPDCEGNWNYNETETIVFRRLSCYANKYNIYLAANVGEFVLCEPGDETDDGGKP